VGDEVRASGIARRRAEERADAFFLCERRRRRRIHSAMREQLTTGGESVRVSAWAAGLILSIGLLCGCNQQAASTEDLIQALSEAHSAIASSILAIDLYDQQRSTRAVTETLLGDMTEQIVDAERAVNRSASTVSRPSLTAMPRWPRYTPAWLRC
jgi:hypothetical protein